MYNLNKFKLIMCHKVRIYILLLFLNDEAKYQQIEKLNAIHKTI